MSTRARKRILFRPYRFESNAVRLYLLRPEDEPGNPIEVSAALDELADWRELDFRVEAEVAEGRAHDALLEGKARIWVRLRCRNTRFREALELEKHGSRWRGELSLRRETLAEVVHLEPAIVAIESLGARDAQRGQEIASGRRISLRIDPQTTSSRGHLQVLFRSFAESPDIVAPAEALYWLDADSETPVLWLNEDHPQASMALQARGTRGAAARTRDLVFDAIASSVWQQLFVQALEGYDEHGEPEYPWQKHVLELLGAQLFPDEAAASIVERTLAELEYTSTAHLISRLDLVLQTRHQLADHLNKLVEEVF